MPATDRPRLSVGMPVYNGEPYVGLAIESILAQTLSDLELVISDNGSDDGTAAVCQAAAARDARVRYFREERNRGAAWNYNRVLQLARGTFFHWAAADDLFDPTYAARCVELLESDPTLILAYTTTVILDGSGNTGRRMWRPPPGYAAQTEPAHRFRDILHRGGMCFEVFGVTRRSDLVATSGIEPFTSSDRSLLAELALRGRFGHVDEPLFKNRIHEKDSMHAHPDAVERIRWFDPDGALRFPRWVLLRAYAGKITVAGSRGDQAAATGVLCGWMWRQRRALVFDLANVLPQSVSARANKARRRHRNRRDQRRRVGT